MVENRLIVSIKLKKAPSGDWVLLGQILYFGQLDDHAG